MAVRWNRGTCIVLSFWWPKLTWVLVYYFHHGSRCGLSTTDTHSVLGWASLRTKMYNRQEEEVLRWLVLSLYKQWVGHTSSGKFVTTHYDIYQATNVCAQLCIRRWKRIGDILRIPVPRSSLASGQEQKRMDKIQLPFQQGTMVNIKYITSLYPAYLIMSYRYFIAVTHVYHFVRRSEVTLYINGQMVEQQYLIFPKMEVRRTFLRSYSFNSSYCL